MGILGFIRKKCLQVRNAVLDAIPELSSQVHELLDTAQKGVRRLCSWVWQGATNAFVAARNFVIAHPWLTAAVVLAVVIPILAILLAHPTIIALGFGPGGVKTGSFAAWIQSTFYGGFVPAWSIFSFLQSCGARF